MRIDKVEIEDAPAFRTEESATRGTPQPCSCKCAPRLGMRNRSVDKLDRTRRLKNSGFALMVSLLLMSFVVLLMLTLSVTLKVETQAASTNMHLMKARSNAMLGLQVGLGELQRLAGPDTRITARADILPIAADSPYHYWTGVWDSQDTDSTLAKSDHTQRRAYDPSARAQALGWLASGLAGMSPEDIDPLTIHIPASDSALLVSGQSSADPPAVYAGKQPVTTTNSSGSYAWWAGDEGIKARIDTNDPIRDRELELGDLAGPTFETGTDAEKETLLSAALAQKNGISHVGAPWSKLSTVDLKKLGKAFSYESARSAWDTLTAQEQDVFKANRHDLTTYSYGLLTDVRQGGFKKDLSLAFQEPEVFEQFFGVEPSVPNFNTNNQNEQLSLGTMDFIDPPRQFFLTPELQATNKIYDVGPNWGILYNYYNLYKTTGLAEDGAINPILIWPKTVLAATRAEPLPYQNFRAKFNTAREEQPINSPVAPILERFQFNVRVGAVQTENFEGETAYKIRFYIQPLIGIWNPYNVKIKAAGYNDYYYNTTVNPRYPRLKFESEAAPEFEISGTYDDGTTFTETVSVAEAFMRSEAGTNYTDGFWAVLTPQDIDFLPGEIRLLSAKAPAEGNFRENELDYGWEESEGFYFDWPFDYGLTRTPELMEYVSDSPVTIHSVRIKENTGDRDATEVQEAIENSGAFAMLKHESPNLGVHPIQYTSSLWKDPVYAARDPALTDSRSPGVVTAGTIPPFTPSSALGENYKDVGAWLFHLRTTYETNKGLRNLIDTNQRSSGGSPRWDGPGLFATGAYQAFGDNNGYLAPGSVLEPTFGDYDRFSGINGASITNPSLGTSRMILYDVPRYPAVSLGQFQHAALAHYSFESSYLLSNSYANPRIPLDSIQVLDFDGMTQMNLFDTSYMVNDQVFDEYFLSTVDSALSEADFQALVEGKKKPYNTRLLMTTPDGATRNEVLDLSDANSLEAWGGRFMVDGAFNINSTSVSAWKAIFGSMDQPFLRVNLDGVNADTFLETDPEGVYVSRLSLPIFETGYAQGSNDQNAFFQGYRKLSDLELTDLATAMVAEVKARGPFLSMADFINRRLNGATIGQQQRGALQAALDNTVNQNIASNFAGPVTDLDTAFYSDAIDDSSDSQAAGYPGYVLQGDLLQPLAPIMSPRSDTFIIRAYGSSDSISGGSTEAWCEAVVQRFPDMVGTGNDLSSLSLQELGAQTADLNNVLNQNFGRAFRIVAFRWLNKDEL